MLAPPSSLWSHKAPVRVQDIQTFPQPSLGPCRAHPRRALEETQEPAAGGWRVNTGLVAFQLCDASQGQ